MIELRVDNLKLLKSGLQTTSYHIVHSTTLDPAKDNGHVYTVAFLEKDGEGDWNLRTIGKRPWTMEGATPYEFMVFAGIAIQLLEKMKVEKVSPQ